MGAALQQRVMNAWQPLAFFSKKLYPAQQKYSAYDRELLAIYETVKYFRQVLDARNFIIFTDHKPITYAFQQKRDKCSLWQFNHLDFVAPFTTDIRHISGQDNVVADALSPVESVNAPPPYDALVTLQDSDDELQTFLKSTTALRLEKLPIPRTTVSICCDSLPGDLGRRFQLPYGSKCSSPSMICRTQTLNQHQSWSHSVLCDEACRRNAAPGHGLASPASVPKSPATQLLHWATLRPGSPFPSRPRRLRGAPSDILPHRSRPFHPLARSRPHPGHHC
jgi:hypothetical protein